MYFQCRKQIEVRVARVYFIVIFSVQAYASLESDHFLYLRVHSDKGMEEAIAFLRSAKTLYMPWLPCLHKSGAESTPYWKTNASEMSKPRGSGALKLTSRAGPVSAVLLFYILTAAVMWTAVGHHVYGWIGLCFRCGPYFMYLAAPDQTAPPLWCNGSYIA